MTINYTLSFSYMYGGHMSDRVLFKSLSQLLILAPLMTESEYDHYAKTNVVVLKLACIIITLEVVKTHLAGPYPQNF